MSNQTMCGSFQSILCPSGYPLGLCYKITPFDCSSSPNSAPERSGGMQQGTTLGQPTNMFAMQNTTLGQGTALGQPNLFAPTTFGQPNLFAPQNPTIGQLLPIVPFKFRLTATIGTAPQQRYYLHFSHPLHPPPPMTEIYFLQLLFTPPSSPRIFTYDGTKIMTTTDYPVNVPLVVVMNINNSCNFVGVHQGSTSYIQLQPRHVLGTVKYVMVNNDLIAKAITGAGVTPIKLVMAPENVSQCDAQIVYFDLIPT